MGPSTTTSLASFGRMRPPSSHPLPKGMPARAAMPASTPRPLSLARRVIPSPPTYPAQIQRQKASSPRSHPFTDSLSSATNGRRRPELDKTRTRPKPDVRRGRSAPLGMMPSLNSEPGWPSGRFEVGTRYLLYARSSRDEEDHGRHAGARSPAGMPEQQERSAAPSQAPATEQGIDPTGPRRPCRTLAEHRIPPGDGPRGVSDHRSEARHRPRHIDPRARPRAPPRIGGGRGVGPPRPPERTSRVGWQPPQGGSP